MHSRLLDSLHLLPQPQLINRVSNYIRVAYLLKYNIDRSTKLYFSFNNCTHSYKPPVWRSHPPPSQKAYDLFLDADTFISFLTLQIENSFIAFGELSTTAMHLADNLLFTYEFDFSLQLINLYHIASLVPKTRYNLRALQHAEIQGIYPHPELKVEIEHDTTPLPFLDIRLSPKYKAIQFNCYPDIRSELAPQISANILNTSACNFLKLSRKKEFVAHVIHAMLTLYFKHKHNPNPLKLLLRNFYYFCIQHQNRHSLPQQSPLSVYEEVTNSVRHHLR
eukprot:g41759.t1